MEKTREEALGLLCAGVRGRAVPWREAEEQGQQGRPGLEPREQKGSQRQGLTRGWSWAQAAMRTRVLCDPPVLTVLWKLPNSMIQIL